LPERLGNAEINHLRYRLAVLQRYEHVVRLDVAMNDPLLRLRVSVGLWEYSLPSAQYRHRNAHRSKGDRHWDANCSSSCAGIDGMAPSCVQTPSASR
jgi:hypothetical protein